MTETLHAEGDRTVLRIERRYPHGREKVWRAITEPAQLSQWFPASVEFVLEIGAEVLFDAGDGALKPDGVVTEVEPLRSFAFTWSGEQLRWELHDDGSGGCVLIFSHAFRDHYGAASFCSGWVECLNAMEKLISGMPVTHVRPSAELHDSYVTRFGLDQGVAEVDQAGWRLRFERQLTQPAEVVWDLLLEHAGAASTADTVPGGLTVDGVRPGTVVETEAPRVFEYEWHHPAVGDALPESPAGRVRWELRDGTGHGARLVLTQTGSAATTGDHGAALSAWRARIDTLAARLRERERAA